MSSSESRAPGNLELACRAVMKEIRELSRVLICLEMKGNTPSAKLPACERKGLSSFLLWNIYLHCKDVFLPGLIDMGRTSGQRARKRRHQETQNKYRMKER